MPCVALIFCIQLSTLWKWHTLLSCVCATLFIHLSGRFVSSRNDCLNTISIHDFCVSKSFWLFEKVGVMVVITVMMVGRYHTHFVDMGHCHPPGPPLAIQWWPVLIVTHRAICSQMALKWCILQSQKGVVVDPCVTCSQRALYLHALGDTLKRIFTVCISTTSSTRVQYAGYKIEHHKACYNVYDATPPLPYGKKDTIWMRQSVPLQYMLLDYKAKRSQSNSNAV